MFGKQTILYWILFSALQICAVALKPGCATSVCRYSLCPWTFVIDVKSVTSYFSNRCKLSFCRCRVRDGGVIQMVSHGKDFNRPVVTVSFLHAWLIKAVSFVSEGERNNCLAVSCPWKCVLGVELIDNHLSRLSSNSYYSSLFSVNHFEVLFSLA